MHCLCQFSDCKLLRNGNHLDLLFRCLDFLYNRLDKAAGAILSLALLVLLECNILLVVTVSCNTVRIAALVRRTEFLRRSIVLAAKAAAGCSALSALAGTSEGACSLAGTTVAAEAGSSLTAAAVTASLSVLTILAIGRSSSALISVTGRSRTSCTAAVCIKAALDRKSVV